MKSARIIDFCLLCHEPIFGRHHDMICQPCHDEERRRMVEAELERRDWLAEQRSHLPGFRPLDLPERIGS